MITHLRYRKSDYSTRPVRYSRGTMVEMHSEVKTVKLLDEFGLLVAKIQVPDRKFIVIYYANCAYVRFGSSGGTETFRRVRHWVSPDTASSGSPLNTVLNDD